MDKDYTKFLEAIKGEPTYSDEEYFAETGRNFTEKEETEYCEFLEVISG